MISVIKEPLQPDYLPHNMSKSSSVKFRTPKLNFEKGHFVLLRQYKATLLQIGLFYATSITD